VSETKKLGILIDILGSYFRSGEEKLFYCPYCKHHKAKLSLNVAKNVYKCWVCDNSGRDLRRLVRRFGTFLQKREWDKLSNRLDMSTIHELFPEAEDYVEQTTSLPDDFVSLTNGENNRPSLSVRSYLKTRGIGYDDVLRWKIGYCPSGEYKNRVIIPSFNMEGRVNYFTARSYTNDYPKYKNPTLPRDIVFNQLYVDWDKDLVLVEGIFDAIVAGPNAIPILGSDLRENSRLFQEIVKHDTPIYMALDPDMEKKAMKLISSLLSYDAEIYKIDISPHNDVGEMSKEEFNVRKNEAVFLNSDNYLMYRVWNSL